IRKHERGQRKIIHLFIGFKSSLCQDQAEQIANKHIDRERPSVELELITVLANLVSIKHRERLSLDRAQISVRNDRARKVVWVRRKLLRELNDPFVGFRIANLANAEARSRYVVVGDLQVMI